MASPARRFVAKGTKALALRVFFNEAFRLDAQPYADRKHQSARRVSFGVFGNRRDILVYLPPGYRRFSWRRHSVLYLHDGQNVFDAATSFGGVEWGVDETAERLIRTKFIDPLIIFAVANTGEDRLDGNNPTP